MNIQLKNKRNQYDNQYIREFSGRNGNNLPRMLKCKSFYYRKGETSINKFPTKEIFR